MACFGCRLKTNPYTRFCRIRHSGRPREGLGARHHLSLVFGGAPGRVRPAGSREPAGRAWGPYEWPNDRPGTDRHRQGESHLPAAARQAGAGARRRVAGGASRANSSPCSAPPAAVNPRCFIWSAAFCRSRPAASWSRASRSQRPAPIAASSFSTLRCSRGKPCAATSSTGSNGKACRAPNARQRAQALHRPRRAARFRGQLPVAAVRRHETAHRDRPHARLRSQHPADGRAVRRARRANPRADADRTAQHLAAHAEDRYLCHP